MNLYDILACPLCKAALVRQEQTLTCSQCDRVYPIVDNVPVLLPDGGIPVTRHQDELLLRQGYDRWLHRVVLQSLPVSSITLEVGAGNMALDLPNLIRMDVTLTPYVDVVGDVHALPFLPKVFDFIFSLAVVEHLRQPFVAAQEMYNALRQGGYVFGDCSFVFPYHGYPHHYFNASRQGLEQVFASFALLRSGVAPYQMPSFGIRPLLQTYLHHLGQDDDPVVSHFRRQLEDLLEHPWGTFDGRFSEEAALFTAAGTFYFGVKSPQGISEVIPSIVQSLWRERPDLQERFPNMFNLGTSNNILLWAKTEGRHQIDALASYADSVIPFRKRDMTSDDDQKAFAELPVVEPLFGHIPDSPHPSSSHHHQFEVPSGVNTTIHPDDQMYKVIAAAGGGAEHSRSKYFQTGMAIVDAARRIVKWKFGGVDRVSAFLDFAAGYGRSTRFLVTEIPAQRVWVADILADAVEFQQEQFGVNGLVSTTRPEDFSCDRKFDCIFVSSLFTHLPATTFVRWLHKLNSLLAPDSVLIFSVHDEAVSPPGVIVPESGFLYGEGSEIDVLDGRDYGSTVVTEAFVREAIHEATGREADRRIKKGLCHLQDIYVVVNAPEPDFSDLRFDYRSQGNLPVGHLDHCALTPAGELTLAGWAADTAVGMSIRKVQVLVNGQLRQQCRPSVPRPDVAKHLGDEENEQFLYSGWICSCDIRGGTESRDMLVVRAISNDGTECVLASCTAKEALSKQHKVVSPGRNVRILFVKAARIYRQGGVKALSTKALGFLYRLSARS